jgi:hypothetical protein
VFVRSGAFNLMENNAFRHGWATIIDDIYGFQLYREVCQVFPLNSYNVVLALG